MIKVYSTPSCSSCRALKRWLTEKELPFEDIDLSENADLLDEVIEKSGSTSVPITEIRGYYVVGFKKKEIEELLKTEEN